ncbi:MAG: hybrid sensor histidine kinase/response regulator [Flammeovirgaceae bacterium]|nr:MAG: hybrid sensor histidine kinase/response regulator [Flammeovirgaceae bacterium]
MKELKILMLEDLEDDAMLIERQLRKDGLMFIRKRVETRQAFVEALNDYLPDVILSDHALPQFNSIEALKLLKHQHVAIPFILVTGAVSEEFAVSCLKLGADDYVLKSNLSRLSTAIASSLRHYEMERNRKSAEKNLRKQNEELIKVYRELDNFVYSVSHNLRAPLLSVLGLIQLAERDDNHKRFQHYWDMMTKSIHKLDETVKEIIDYSKNSRTEMVFTEVKLDTLIISLLQNLRYLVGYDKIDFQLHTKQSVPFYSDTGRLSIILTNLFSNAIKYRNPFVDSYVSIQVSVVSLEAVFLIRDNGIGISEELQPRIFEMFFRATERSEGAGLGLYIVKEAVAKLKGSINVESKAGEYTLFTVIIPNKQPS